MKIKLVRLFYFFLSFLILSQGVRAGAGDLGTWYGYVIVDNAVVASDNTTVVSAYINMTSTLVGNTTVGSAMCELSNCTGFYYIDVQANEGDNITFKVNGVNVSQAQQVFSAGPHSLLNLTMNKTANGVACTYDNGCISGYCVNGYCCDSACTGACNFCNVSGSQGTCTDANTECSGTSSSCYCSSGSCVACSSGYTCSAYSCTAIGGGGGGGGGLVITSNVSEEEETEEVVEEEVVTEEETPAVCTESWSCSEWSECVDGTSTRTCTDSNNCGTVDNKPTESQSCTVTPETPTIPLGVGVGLAAIVTASIVISIFIIRRNRLNLKKKQSLRTVL